MKKFLLILSVATLLLDTPAAQAAFVPHSAEVVTASISTSFLTVITSEAVVESSAAAKIVKAKKLSFFGKLKHYFGGSKSQVVAALLAFFLGTLGVHRFYLGHTGIGLTQLVLTLVGFGLLIGGFLASVVAGGIATFSVVVVIGLLFIAGVSVWSIIDLIRILTGDLQPKGGSYDKTF